MIQNASETASSIESENESTNESENASRIEFEGASGKDGSGGPGRMLEHLDRALDAADALVPLEEARFLAASTLYEERSDQRRRIREWFLERVAPSVPRGRPFRVLSVGCGSGLLDVPVAEAMAERTDDLLYVGVNPNRVECDAFERAFETADLPGAELEVVPCAFEDFEAACDFDLVHFVHSLYYLADPAAALEKARGMLGPNGRLLLFHAPRGAMNELATRFYDKQYARPTLFAEDVAALFDAWSWKYERARIDARVDVTPLVADGGGEAALALRDFIVQVEGERLPGAVRDLVGRYLRAISVQQDGRAFIAHPVDVFLSAG